ncbi:unnamed protein product [Sphagnum balticum]
MAFVLSAAVSWSLPARAILAMGIAFFLFLSIRLHMTYVYTWQGATGPPRCKPPNPEGGLNKFIVPDAISTGTGLGLLDDSGKFLKNITEADEGVVSPTAFIQSTHNTVSSNIALTVGCTGHNNTFVHKGFSFESALTDAQMLVADDPAMRNVLVGAYDETTDYSFAVMQRLRLLRDTPVSSSELLSRPGSGTIAGEGAAFFLLSTSKNHHTYAALRGTDILYKPHSIDKVKSKLEAFLSRHQMVLSDVDIVISGLCGDSKRDELLREMNDDYFPAQTILGYKHLCGEYMTSSAFALWIGAMIIQIGKIPSETVVKWPTTTDCKSVLFGVPWFESTPAHT